MDKYPGWSPYNYVMNNPLVLVDPDGMRVEEFEVDALTGVVTKTGDKGGKETDYYSIVGLTENGETVASETIAINREESGATINVIRFSESEKSTISILHIPETNTSGYILEPPGPSTSKANQNKRIPEGQLNVEAYSSAKFKDAFLLSNDIVSKTRRILIHTGNYPEHTVGCLLPGNKWYSENSVKGSGDMYKIIKRFIGSKGINTTKLNIVSGLK